MSSQERSKAYAALGEVARMMFAYFIQLTESGFDRTEALTLTVAYQAMITSSTNKNIEGSDDER